jgi:NAD(P)-dependent dehydrogenase (short-subunit alcohol dehydrogenase family)
MPRLATLAKAGAAAGLWFVEGHGSNGSIIDGVSVYGTAKRALAYLWRALAVESKATGVTVGALSPGIMATDFILAPAQRGPDWERTKRLFNILADHPETVARFAVPRILGCSRTGRLIAWLTPAKAFARFASAAFRKRRIIE